ncbi:hypothetical protein PG996_005142 [Apiospora saccharicola]|uniref:Uncharacterized protein n=1 Tax=Apiospora saccharicola TaxID=335842 RepID=A0ABR1VPG2_9PEZI
MYKTLAVVPFLLLGGVQAKPCLKCTPDSCYLVALETGVAGQNPKDECSAFMRTTVTPSTSYATVTATAFQTVDVTDVLTQSKFDTATETTATRIDTIFETRTLYPPAGKSKRKRAGVVSPDLANLHVGGRRDVPLAVPLAVPGAVRVSVGPAGGSVPAYATDLCLDIEAFSSACRCHGVRKTTITAPVPSATLTVTNTAQVTQTSQTDLVLSLTTTTTQSQFVTVTEIVSLTMTVPVTTTVDQAGSGGPNDLVVKFSGSTYPSSGGYIKIGQDGKLDYNYNQYYAETPAAARSLLHFRKDSDIANEGDVYLDCAAVESGLLTCTRPAASAGPVVFQICPEDALGENGDGVVVSTKLEAGCTRFDFYVYSYWQF